MTRVPGSLSASLIVLQVGGLIALAVMGSRNHVLPQGASGGAELSASQQNPLPHVAQPPAILAAPISSSPAARAQVASSQVADALEFVVLTRKEWNSREPVPRIRVVVGLGVPPVGRPVDATQSDLYEVVTDDQGRASVWFPRSEMNCALQQPGGAVWARVVEPEHTQLTYEKRSHQIFADGNHFILVTHPGFTVRGRVVDESGAPVAARIGSMVDEEESSEAVEPRTRLKGIAAELARAGALDRVGKFGMSWCSQAEGDGWFEVLTSRASIGHLLFDARDSGTGVLRDLDLAAPVTAPLEVRVHGPGVLRGRVFDDGEPVPSLELGVWMSALDVPQGGMRLPVADGWRRREPGDVALPEPAHSSAQLEGRGCTWATTSTDADGAFEVRGVRQDQYILAAEGGWGQFSYRLSPAPVAADGSPLELRVERWVINVRIVSESGEPWKGAVGMGELSQWPRGASRAKVTDRWPAEVTLVVVPTREHVDANRYVSPRRAGSVDEDGVFRISVADGKRYRVGLIGGFQPWKPVEVEGSKVVLTATSVDACGALSLRVFDGQGTLLRDGFSIRIEDPQDGATLLFDDLGKDKSSPQGFRLPEGTYRVVVQGEPLIEHYHGTVSRRSGHGRFESLFDVRRDATTKIDATLPAGARIRLSLAGEVLDEDRDAVRAAHSPGMSFGSSIDDWAGRAATQLMTFDRWPTLVSFTYDVPSSSAAGTHLGDWLMLGTEATSELLPAGWYRFEARLPGGRSSSTDVILVDGETTTVALAIGPRPTSATK